MATNEGDEAAVHLAANLRQLRAVRGLTQAQGAKSAGIPRATWAHLESAEGNPTLAVLQRVSKALHVSLEELLAPVRGGTKLLRAAELPSRSQGAVRVQKAIGEKVDGVELERIELPPKQRLTGVPHTAGTREHLSCAEGTIVLFVAGERFELNEGDTVVFRGDQRHSYINESAARAIGYSLLLLRET